MDARSPACLAVGLPTTHIDGAEQDNAWNMLLFVFSPSYKLIKVEYGENILVQT